jgi:hypothetical protein
MFVDALRPDDPSIRLRTLAIRHHQFSAWVATVVLVVQAHRCCPRHLRDAHGLELGLSSA